MNKKISARRPTPRRLPSKLRSESPPDEIESLGASNVAADPSPVLAESHAVTPPDAAASKILTD